jgi:YhcH/YjgK/YiaL family protein
MIVDIIENIGLYEGLDEKIVKGLSYIKNTDFISTPSGKYTIEGDDIFAIVNEFETKPAKECELEAHQKHLDIQYIVKGTELFGYVPLKAQTPSTPYNADKDVSIYQDEVSYIRLTPGMFIIFYPTDIHQPEVQYEASSLVKKVVVKVRL